MGKEEVADFTTKSWVSLAYIRVYSSKENVMKRLCEAFTLTSAFNDSN